ncbi:PREDICTED: uncharacterized protein LOC109486018 [Branchiostoma belcheri]|uniref:Uncharacterized protein LOC109486018 n=1 Tax=Branchiostoma belcheri TaxID=7741 RepID=A0A6P4ZVP4_BRABE|nr:PREDICTED: uncharacterized protein LOC109486018 [Branchiostoma belcheri]
MSMHEQFLLSFPCINSFSAQVMLTAAPLYQLLTCPMQELVTLCPWIPQKVLQAFYQVAHCEPDINTRTNTPVSSPQPHNDCPPLGSNLSENTMSAGCSNAEMVVRKQNVQTSLQDLESSSVDRYEIQNPPPKYGANVAVAQPYQHQHSTRGTNRQYNSRGLQATMVGYGDQRGNRSGKVCKNGGTGFA